MAHKITPKTDDNGHTYIGSEFTTVGPKVILVNPEERQWTTDRYVLHFGAYGWTQLMVWANHLEDAMECAIDWIVDNAPGLLYDDVVQEAYDEAYNALCMDETLTEDERVQGALEHAETDMTVFGHNGIHYLASWEWGIALSNPTREDLVAYLGSGS